MEQPKFEAGGDNRDAIITDIVSYLERMIDAFKADIRDTKDEAKVQRWEKLIPKYEKIIQDIRSDDKYYQAISDLSKLEFEESDEDISVLLDRLEAVGE